jgi:hypothetical protein
VDLQVPAVENELGGWVFLVALKIEYGNPLKFALLKTYPQFDIYVPDTNLVWLGVGMDIP